MNNVSSANTNAPVGYPWGLSDAQIQEAKAAHKSGSETFYSLAKTLFNDTSGKAYMRARRIVTDVPYSTARARVQSTKTARPGNRKKADRLRYPYGLDERQVEDLITRYAGGESLGDLGHAFWGDRKPAAYQRARNTVAHAARQGKVKLWKSKRRASSKNLTYYTGAKLASQPTTTASTFEPEQEAVIFADLALLYATRLTASVRKGDTIDVAAHYNRLRGALKELTVSLPEGAAGNVENV